MVEGGGRMKISVTNPDYFVLNLPIKARRKTNRRCLKNILFWAGVTGVDSVKRENTGLNHNILQWWMMILIQPEWESATPNQPADRCRTDWFMPRVAYINQLSAGNGSYAEVDYKSCQTTVVAGGLSGGWCEGVRYHCIVIWSVCFDGSWQPPVQSGPCWCWRPAGPAWCLAEPPVLLRSGNYQVQCIGWTLDTSPVHTTPPPALTPHHTLLSCPVLCTV